MWLAGSTNDMPFETLNGLQLPTVGSKTVSVPEATTTATGAPWTCQPKVPPGASRYDSRIVVPDWALIVVAWNFPAASTLATIGVSWPNDGAAAMRAQTTASPINLTFMSFLLPFPLVVGREAREGVFARSLRRLSVRDALSLPWPRSRTS